MHNVGIPKTDLRPSALCLGTVKLGSELDAKASFRLLDTYLDLGGNILDTARVYADWLRGERSCSEKTIGRWLHARKNRGRVILTTKGGHPELATMHIPRLSPAEIQADLNASLKNLQTDCIDLYWLHRDDERRSVEEIMGVLASQVVAGKIRYFGCSNWRLARIQAAEACARQQSLPGFVANQLMWGLAEVKPRNLSDATMVVMDRDMWQSHATTGLAAFAYSAQANGWFQRLASGTTGGLSAAALRMYNTSANKARFGQVQALAAATGLTLTQIVLGYLLAQPFPVVAIIGSRNLDQLRDSLTAADVHLSPDQVAFLVSARREAGLP